MQTSIILLSENLWILHFKLIMTMVFLNYKIPWMGLVGDFIFHFAVITNNDSQGLKTITSISKMHRYSSLKM